MKALIAMSGGVDSSVAAFLMKERGFDCVGCTMKLYENEDIGIPEGRTCCSLDDVEDARSVAFRLGIPYYVFNFTGDFNKNVIDNFIKCYERGVTPNPCIDCNRYMKFDRLYERAKVLGCDYIVTGHYARVEEENGKFFLKKALDPDKDQSYVLYFLNQEQLAHTMFPLGSLTKDKTRETAEKNGFVNFNKPDSQDICFVPDGDYAKVIEERTGRVYPKGSFVGRDGRIYGEHKGIINYTIGQRKGLGISAPEPLYVLSINPENNTVVLGSNDDLFTDELYADNFSWISGEAPTEEFRCSAKIRYRQKEQPATVTPLENNRVKIKFDAPLRAVTPGQSAVLYDGDTVLGGGIIEKI
ncbi:MAG: tRNA 2-thiouridine(34) synthase MnmA [Clostridia bacterium]|nr:tRNA 2-thiouridine(34) synthase MnmA [Clostridia bacterium]